ncbi:MAG: hypothetical protein U0637_13910 [Phycisphaerales bacterium]
MRCAERFIAAGVLGTGAATLFAQPEFFLVGTPTSNLEFRVTDISEGGGTVVGLTGTDGAWRWDRGVGYQVMPTLTVPGGTCSAYSAFVSADGTRVVGHGGGAQCAARVRQVFLWTQGGAPVIGPNNSASTYVTVKGINAAGTLAGLTVEEMGYLEMGTTQVLGPNSYSRPTTPGIYVQGCGLPGDWYATNASGMTPDGAVLGSIFDCNDMFPGIVWRGGLVHTRLAEVPVAGSWYADVIISQQRRYTAGGTQSQALSFAPGSVATDVSWDGGVITANVPVGPLTRAGYSVNNGQPNDLQLALQTAGAQLPAGIVLQSAAAVSGDGRWITGMALLASGQRQAYIAHIPGMCGDLDFNNDGISPDTFDIETLLCAVSGDCCWQAVPACDSIDINMDGLFPDVADIEAFLTMFSGGTCF